MISSFKVNLYSIPVINWYSGNCFDSSCLPLYRDQDQLLSSLFTGRDSAAQNDISPPRSKLEIFQKVSEERYVKIKQMLTEESLFKFELVDV